MSQRGLHPFDRAGTARRTTARSHSSPGTRASIGRSSPGVGVAVSSASSGLGWAGPCGTGRVRRSVRRFGVLGFHPGEGPRRALSRPMTRRWSAWQPGPTIESSSNRRRWVSPLGRARSSRSSRPRTARAFGSPGTTDTRVRSAPAPGALGSFRQRRSRRRGSRFSTSPHRREPDGGAVAALGPRAGETVMSRQRSRRPTGRRSRAGWSG